MLEEALGGRAAQEVPVGSWPLIRVDGTHGRFKGQEKAAFN